MERTEGRKGELHIFLLTEYMYSTVYHQSASLTSSLCIQCIMRKCYSVHYSAPPKDNVQALFLNYKFANKIHKTTVLQNCTARCGGGRRFLIGPVLPARFRPFAGSKSLFRLQATCDRDHSFPVSPPSSSTPFPTLSSSNSLQQ
jgi:hypothetical protein